MGSLSGNSLELGGLRFHGDGEAQDPRGVPAGGVDVIPAEDKRVGSDNPSGRRQKNVEIRLNEQLQLRSEQETPLCFKEDRKGNGSPRGRRVVEGGRLQQHRWRRFKFNVQQQHEAKDKSGSSRPDGSDGSPQSLFGPQEVEAGLLHVHLEDKSLAQRRKEAPRKRRRR